MKVSDTKPLARVLDRMNADYKIISDTEADIYAKINISKLASALANDNCEVVSVSEKDESLESYYINLIGGEENV